MRREEGSGVRIGIKVESGVRREEGSGVRIGRWRVK